MINSIELDELNKLIDKNIWLSPFQKKSLKEDFKIFNNKEIEKFENHPDTIKQLLTK